MFSKYARSKFRIFLLAALLIGLIQSVCGFLLDDAWAKIITYALLYATLVLRPQGLFGRYLEE